MLVPNATTALLLIQQQLSYSRNSLIQYVVN